MMFSAHCTYLTFLPRFIALLSLVFSSVHADCYPFGAKYSNIVDRGSLDAFIDRFCNTTSSYVLDSRELRLGCFEVGGGHSILFALQNTDNVNRKPIDKSVCANSLREETLACDRGGTVNIGGEGWWIRNDPNSDGCQAETTLNK